jgi:hypothetical protein
MSEAGVKKKGLAFQDVFEKEGISNELRKSRKII